MSPCGENLRTVLVAGVSSVEVAAGVDGQAERVVEQGRSPEALGEGAVGPVAIDPVVAAILHVDVAVSADDDVAGAVQAGRVRCRSQRP